MRLIDIANKIDKSEKNECWIDVSEIADEEFGIDVPYVEQNRLKCFWIGNWYCTDSYVGYRMYFLDDQPVGFSTQLGRKLDEDFKWFSIECANSVKDCLISLLSHDKEHDDYNIWDINEEVGDSFKIDYNSQILNKDRVVLNNEKVEIVEMVKNDPYGIGKELKIKLSNGLEKEVNIRDLDFGYHVME